MWVEGRLAAKTMRGFETAPARGRTGAAFIGCPWGKGIRQCITKCPPGDWFRRQKQQTALPGRSDTDDVLSPARLTCALCGGTRCEQADCSHKGRPRCQSAIPKLANKFPHDRMIPAVRQMKQLMAWMLRPKHCDTLQKTPHQEPRQTMSRKPRCLIGQDKRRKSEQIPCTGTTMEPDERTSSIWLRAIQPANCSQYSRRIP